MLKEDWRVLSHWEVKICVGHLFKGRTRVSSVGVIEGGKDGVNPNPTFPQEVLLSPIVPYEPLCAHIATSVQTVPHLHEVG